MSHFICTGECGGVSNEAGVCQSGDCSKHNQALVECSCQDGNHNK